MKTSKRSVLTQIVSASLFLAGCAQSPKETNDPWALSRCVLGLLPPPYYTDNDNSKILGQKIASSEIRKFIDDAPPGLSDAIREETKRLWPTEKKFQQTLGNRIDDSAADLAFSLARNLSDRFQLGTCGNQREVEMSVVSILSDRVSSIFRGNTFYESIPIGAPGPSYLVMMAAGATMNGYSNSLDALSGRPSK
jgi:hypothetical protein